jgi:hypothetical protein
MLSRNCLHKFTTKWSLSYQHWHTLDKKLKITIVFIFLVTIHSFIYIEGLLWSWSYSSWIYNYLCNQCLSLLTLNTILLGTEHVGNVQQVSQFYLLLSPIQINHIGRDNVCIFYIYGLGLWCLTPLSTIFQLYRGGQYYSFPTCSVPSKISFIFRHKVRIFCFSSNNKTLNARLLARVITGCHYM